MMRCVFCNQSLIGSADAISIEGGAPSHRKCYQMEQLSKRIFKGLELAALADGELVELQDLIRQEQNSRSPGELEVELF